MTAHVLISLSSFGADAVREGGQLAFTQLALQAGADGVEVRGELLRNAETELQAIAEAVGDGPRVYSSPDGLWGIDAALDIAALDAALDWARRLRAPRLKMAIGGWRAASATTLPALRERLAVNSIELVIENDQNAGAGSVDALRRFFAAADDSGLDIGMTFDIGNWHWVGECPLQAAQAFAPRVRYVHCKGVQREACRWIAVPLADSAAPWRAVLRALPADVPWAIEYPLIGDDLPAATRREVAQLRRVAKGPA